MKTQKGALLTKYSMSGFAASLAMSLVTGSTSVGGVRLSSQAGIAQ